MGTPTDKRFAIRRKDKYIHLSRVRCMSGQQTSCVSIPQLDAAVPTSADKGAAIWGKDECLDCRTAFLVPCPE